MSCAFMHYWDRPQVIGARQHSATRREQSVGQAFQPWKGEQDGTTTSLRHYS
jgi:hypothetical protein